MTFIPASTMYAATSTLDPALAPPVTVQFLRWTSFGNTAYQKGQFAGFSEAEAERLAKSGAARIVERK